MIDLLEWYFAQSKSHLALPNNERELWAVVLGQQLDDLLPKLSEEVKKKLNKFENDLFAGLLSLSLFDIGQPLMRQ